VVSWTLGSLGPDATAQVTFIVTATHSITNSAYSVKAAGGFNTAGLQPVFTAVSPAPKPLLTISKYGPAVVASGASLTYTLIVTNSGTAIATNLIITDAIPAGGTYVGGGTRIGNVVSWTVPALAANGGMILRSFVVTATRTITNSSYGVQADGGYQAKGLTSVKTLVKNKEEDKIKTYLPLIIKN
jgi:large repetitive protein